MSTKEKVPVDEIEKALGELWKEVSDPTQMKACLFNLIVYTKNAERADHFNQLIRSVLEKLPSRIIFIVSTNHSKDGELYVSVSNDMMGKKENSVPCDQIFLEVSGEKRVEIPFIVLPLIVPDLPVYFVWGEEPAPEDPLLKQFIEIGNRVVFDSEYTGNIQKYSQKMLSLISLNQAEIMDMKWAHVSRWRHILASIFDSREKHAHLHQIKDIQLNYAGQAHGNIHHDQTQALLLQAWLGSRLHWKFDRIVHDPSLTTIYYHSTENNVEIRLNPIKNEDLPPAALEGIVITTTDGSIYEVNRLKTYPKVIVHLTTDTVCELPFTLPLPRMNRGLTFLKELFYSQVSNQYQDTLEFIASIDWGTCHD